MGILNNKGKPKHKRPCRHIGKPLTALAAVLCVAIAPIASANMNVIDVSGWQSADVTRVVDADAAIVKITEGGGYVNPSWRSQTDWARQTGKACGGYHYADGGNVTAEVNHYLNQFSGYVGQCVLALDWESNGNAAWAMATGCASGSTRCIRVPRSGPSCTCRTVPYIRFRPTCAPIACCGRLSMLP